LISLHESGRVLSPDPALVLDDEWSLDRWLYKR
jgi:hypothetical protein